MFKKSILPLLLVLGCGSCNPDESETAEEISPITWTACSYEVDDHPCDFTLKDQDGKDWTLYDYYGSIIILDFSTEWCGYCQLAASESETFRAQYIDDNVLYITIMIEDRYGDSPPAEDIVDYWVEYFGITEPVLSGDRTMLDSTGETGWPVAAWPTFFIIDRDMTLHEKMQGYNGATLMTIIDGILVEEVSTSDP